MGIVMGLKRRRSPNQEVDMRDLGLEDEDPFAAPLSSPPRNREPLSPEDQAKSDAIISKVNTAMTESDMRVALEEAVQFGKARSPVLVQGVQHFRYADVHFRTNQHRYHHLTFAGRSSLKHGLQPSSPYSTKFFSRTKRAVQGMLPLCKAQMPICVWYQPAVAVASFGPGCEAYCWLPPNRAKGACRYIFACYLVP